MQVVLASKLPTTPTSIVSARLGRKRERLPIALIAHPPAPVQCKCRGSAKDMMARNSGRCCRNIVISNCMYSRSYMVHGGSRLSPPVLVAQSISSVVQVAGTIRSIISLSLSPGLHCCPHHSNFLFPLPFRPPHPTTSHIKWQKPHPISSGRTRLCESPLPAPVPHQRLTTSTSASLSTPQH